MTAMIYDSVQPTGIEQLNISSDAQMQLIPAFYDLQSGDIYISRFIDGKIAPMHVYDSLPEPVLKRPELNVVSGFLLNGQFVTGDQAYTQLSDLRTDTDCPDRMD